jgi:O-antigen ligase
MMPRYTQLVGILLFLGFFLPGMPLDGTIPAATLAANTAPRDLSSRDLDVFFWGLFYLAAAALCLRRPQQLAQVAVDHWALFVLLIWLGLSALWGANAQQALMIWIQLVGSLAFAASVTIFLYRDPYAVLRIIAIALAFSMAVNVLAVFAVPSLSLTDTGRWAGVTGNPNYLGSLAGVAALTAIVTLSESRDWLRKGLFGLASLLSIFVMLQADSMTSLVALLTALGWYWFSAVKKFAGGGLFGEILFLVLILAVSTFAFVQLSPNAALDFVGRDHQLSQRIPGIDDPGRADRHGNALPLVREGLQGIDDRVRQKTGCAGGGRRDTRLLTHSQSRRVLFCDGEVSGVAGAAGLRHGRMQESPVAWNTAGGLRARAAPVLTRF